MPLHLSSGSRVADTLAVRKVAATVELKAVSSEMACSVGAKVWVEDVE